jgi:hypothetical protein
MGKTVNSPLLPLFSPETREKGRRFWGLKAVPRKATEEVKKLRPPTPAVKKLRPPTPAVKKKVRGPVEAANHFRRAIEMQVCFVHNFSILHDFNFFSQELRKILHDFNFFSVQNSFRKIAFSDLFKNSNTRLRQG